MSFGDMLEILQEKNKNSIVFIKAGAFYIATARDAVFLNKLFSFKCICFKNQVCKVSGQLTGIEYLNEVGGVRSLQ